MKTTKFFFRLLTASAVTVLAAFAVSCSNSDSIFEESQPHPVVPTTPVHFEAQLGPQGGGESNAKAIDLGDSLSDDAAELGTKRGGPRHILPSPGESDTELNPRWEVGETVALIYEDASDNNAKVLQDVRVASVDADGVATISADLAGFPTDGAAVKIVYPFIAADKNQASGIKEDYLKTGQDGTIATISSKFDVATYAGQFSINTEENTATLRESCPSLDNLYAIVRFVFNSGGAIDNIHRLYITDKSSGDAATDNKLITVTCSNLSTCYVVMDPDIRNYGQLRFTVISDGGTYTGIANVNGIEASKYYRSSLGLGLDGAGAIDLGLPSGTLWATCNVGKENKTNGNYNPEYYGDFFAWGETDGYSGTEVHEFTWENYTFGGSDQGVPPNYGFSMYTSTNVGEGYRTDLISLRPQDDAASVKWNSLWCMPSAEQFNELINNDNTTTLWTNQNGVYGIRITSKSNEKSIFLPAAGYRSYNNWGYKESQGDYATLTLFTDEVWRSYILVFSPSGQGVYTDNGRRMGRTVRPIVAE